MIFLNEFHLEEQTTFREFAQKEIMPLANQIDQENEIPSCIQEQLGKMDAFRVFVAEKYGGLGGGWLDYVVTTQALAKASASVAWRYVASQSVLALIEKFGNEEQINAHMNGLISGKTSGAFAMTEAGSGTNWQKTMQSRVVNEGGKIILRGNKNMISNADAESVIVVVRSAEQMTPFSVYLLKKDNYSFATDRFEMMLGLRGSGVGSLVFDDMHINETDRLGEKSQFPQILQTFSMINSLGQAAVAFGISQAAFESALQYIKVRPIGNDQFLADVEDVRRTISELKQSLDASQLMLYHAASGNGSHIFPALLSCIETALKLTDQTMVLMGGHGCMKGYPMERYFRDAKTVSLQKPIAHIKTMVGSQIVQAA